MRNKKISSIRTDVYINVRKVRTDFPMEGPVGFEPTIRELQSHALPLGYEPMSHAFHYNKENPSLQVEYAKKSKKVLEMNFDTCYNEVVKKIMKEEV